MGIICPECKKSNILGHEKCKYCGVALVEYIEEKPKKSRKATKKQIGYLNGTGLEYPENITSNEASELLGNWETVHDYILDVWKMIFGKSFWDSGIPREELNKSLCQLHKIPSLVKEIIDIKDALYDEASDQANIDREAYEEGDGERPRPFREYFPAIPKDKTFKDIKIFLKANFQKKMPKSFMQKIIGKLFPLLIISSVLSFNTLCADTMLSEANRKQIWLELQKAGRKQTEEIKIEPKFGLSVAKQKEVWQEIRESSRLVTSIVSTICSFSGRTEYYLSGKGFDTRSLKSDHRRLSEDLRKAYRRKYINEIARKYSLTREQIEKIANEGAMDRCIKRRKEELEGRDAREKLMRERMPKIAEREIAREKRIRARLRKIYKEKDEEKIAKQYNLTHKQVEEIYEEGLTKKWTVP